MPTAILAVAFLIVATLYAAVGSGGGSGYLAVMSFAGLLPEVIRPTALTLNVLVASIGTLKFGRAGQFSWALFLPIAASSIPFAYLGGQLTLPGSVYRPVVGLILFFAAYRLYRSASNTSYHASKKIPFWLAIVAGSAIGFLSGVVGVGGAIFLTPLMLLAGWADTRVTMGVSAAFVLVNSIAGLAGIISSGTSLPTALPIWLVAVGVGGWLGAEFGSRRLDPMLLRRLLSLVLVFGGTRMLLG